jgi:hypothetical protein
MIAFVALLALAGCWIPAALIVGWLLGWPGWALVALLGADATAVVGAMAVKRRIRSDARLDLPTDLPLRDTRGGMRGGQPTDVGNRRSVAGGRPARRSRCASPRL